MASQIAVADLGQAQTAWATNPSGDEQIACGHLPAAVFTVECNHHAKLHTTVAESAHLSGKTLTANCVPDARKPMRGPGQDRTL
jgi:hypothetical protein